MIKKQDGSKVNVGVHPSNLQITELNIEDKKRIKNMKKEEKQEKNAEKKSESKEKPQEEKK